MFHNAITGTLVSEQCGATWTRLICHLKQLKTKWTKHVKQWFLRLGHQATKDSDLEMREGRWALQLPLLTSLSLQIMAQEQGTQTESSIFPQLRRQSWVWGKPRQLEFGQRNGEKTATRERTLEVCNVSPLEYSADYSHMRGNSWGMGIEPPERIGGTHRKLEVVPIPIRQTGKSQNSWGTG